MTGTTAPGLDRLMCRLAGGMALLAAAVFLTALLAITRLPLVGTGTDAAYAIPGTQHVLEAAIVPVLAWSGGIAALIGCTVLGLGGFAGGTARWVIVAAAEPRRRSSKRAVLLLAGGAIALAAVVLLKR